MPKDQPEDNGATELIKRKLMFNLVQVYGAQDRINSFHLRDVSQFLQNMKIITLWKCLPFEMDEDTYVHKWQSLLIVYRAIQQSSIPWPTLILRCILKMVTS